MAIRATGGVINNLFSLKKNIFGLLILISSTLSFGMFTVYDKKFFHKVNFREKRLSSDKIKAFQKIYDEPNVVLIAGTRDKKVKMYHATDTLENAKSILKEGLKSRRQLAQEGKAKVPSYESVSGHYSSIFFQYIRPECLKQVSPGLWQRGEEPYCKYLVAIEVDPNETMIYNPDLRVDSPFPNPMNGDVYHSLSPQYRLGVYKSSGMLLSDFIEKKERFEEVRKNDGNGFVSIPHPLTAEPITIPLSRMDRYTGYYWNEYTIQRDKIDPKEFAQ